MMHGLFESIGREFFAANQTQEVLVHFAAFERGQDLQKLVPDLDPDFDRFPVLEPHRGLGCSGNKFARIKDFQEYRLVSLTEMNRVEGDHPHRSLLFFVY